MDAYLVVMFGVLFLWLLFGTTLGSDEPQRRRNEAHLGRLNQRLGISQAILRLHVEGLLTPEIEDALRKEKERIAPSSQEASRV